MLFDLPEVIDMLEADHDRLRLVSGDFFAGALPAADAYVLMEIIHDCPMTSASRSSARSVKRHPPGRSCWSSRA
ncbi:MAG: hypothetical protein H0U07_06810 [Actinobacteria bacterium]|nr:hypothetical protein [Actinomycetota bacterium]